MKSFFAAIKLAGTGVLVGCPMTIVAVEEEVDGTAADRGTDVESGSPREMTFVDPMGTGNLRGSVF